MFSTVWSFPINLGSFSFTFEFTPIQIISYVLLLIEYWIIFEKAYENGWKALIPIYSTYKKYEIADRKNMFWGEILATIVAKILAVFCATSLFVALFGLLAGSFQYAGTSLLLMILYLAAEILAIVFKASRCLSMAEMFGQSQFFGWGLVFLEPVFAGFLAFRKDITY